MTSRAGLRFLHTFRQTFSKQRAQVSQTTSKGGRRSYQSAAENPANAEAPPKNQSRFSQIWNSEVGPKTVHFYAPIVKWGVVLAGASDFARPAEQLSLSQNLALTCTGAIWTRWCFVIKPRNLFLASVNFLLFCVGAAQSTRVLLYQQSLKQDSIGDELKKAGKQEGSVIKDIVEDPKKALKKAENP